MTFSISDYRECRTLKPECLSGFYHDWQLNDYHICLTHMIAEFKCSNCKRILTIAGKRGIMEEA